jgi:hypothetical protein
MQNSIVDLTGLDLNGITPDNFHERTTAAGLNNGLGFRLRPSKELWARVTSGELTREQARQIRFDEILALQASRTTRTATATASEGSTDESR